MSNTSREPSSVFDSSSHEPAGSSAPPTKSSRLAVQLRGRSYDEQVATLTPRAPAAPVQRDQGDAAEPAAPAPSPTQLAEIAISMFQQLARGYVGHTHLGFPSSIDNNGSFTSGALLPLVVPRVLTGSESDLGSLAGALRSELALVAGDLGTHAHMGYSGTPSGPPLQRPVPFHVTGGEQDLNKLADHLRSDFEHLRTWYQQHMHHLDSGPTATPFEGLIINDSELVRFSIQLQTAPAPSMTLR